MGPIRLSTGATRLLRNSTCLALMLGSCAPARPDPLPAPTPAASTPGAALPADRVGAVADGDGRTILTLPPRPDLRLGDSLHIRDGERVVAAALVVDSTDQAVTAWVVALSDRRRAVRVGDQFAAAPVEDLPAVPAADPVHPAEPVADHPREHDAGEAPVSPPKTPENSAPAPAAEHPSANATDHAPIATPVAEQHPAPVVTQSAHPAAENPTAANASVVANHPPEPHHAEDHGGATPSTADHATIAADHAPAAAAAHTAPHGEVSAHVDAPAPMATGNPPDEGKSAALAPEIRARLDAERAYWELAARILRLPGGDGEVAALQERLRAEFAARGGRP